MPSPVRSLIGQVKIDGTDDESDWLFWEEDEKVTREFSVQTILSTSQPSATIQVPDVRWGGECRVETELEAVLAQNGEIKVSGEARLYEGDDESTTDLEDTKSIEITVPRFTIDHTAASTEVVQLRNEGFGGGDHAEIYLRFINVSPD